MSWLQNLIRGNLVSLVSKKKEFFDDANFRDIKSVTRTILGLTGGTSFQTINSFIPQTDIALVGVTMTASFNLTAAKTLRAGVVRNLNQGIVLGSLDECSGVLLSTQHMVTATSTFNIPITKNVGVGFRPPQVPIVNVREPISAYVSDNMAAGENITGSFTVFFIPIT